MRRAPLVIAGTIVGVAGVLAYPTHRPHLVIPPEAGSTGGAAPTTQPPASTGVPAQSTLPAQPPASTARPTAGGVRSATGADTPYPYGDLAVEVKAAGGRITDVVLVTLNDGGSGRSADIDQQAIPLLRQEVLAAQSTDISGVSGATYTSQAYIDSVQSALDQLGRLGSG